MKTFILLAFLSVIGPYVGTTTGRPKSPPCVTGACVDNWSGPAGQTLPAHNTAWVDLNASGGVPCSTMTLSGTGTAGIISPTSPWSNGGCLYSTSTSDTSKVVMIAMGSGTSKLNCVRSQANISFGYCAGLGYASGGNWTKLNLNRNGSQVAQFATGAPWSLTSDHTIVITVSGSNVSGYVDGVLAGTYTDSSPLPAGHPSIYVIGTGSNSDLLFGPWQDHV